MLKHKIIILSALLPFALGSCKAAIDVVNASYISEMEQYCKNYPSLIQLFDEKPLMLIKPFVSRQDFGIITTSEDDKRVNDMLYTLNPKIVQNPAKVNDTTGDSVPRRIKCSSITYNHLHSSLNFYIDGDSSFVMGLFLYHRYAGGMKCVYSLTEQEYEKVGITFDLVYGDYASRPQSYEPGSESSTSELDEAEPKEDTSLTTVEATNSTDGADQDYEIESC